NLLLGRRVTHIRRAGQRILKTRHLHNRLIMRSRGIGGRFTGDLAPRMRMTSSRLIPEGITEAGDRVHRLLMGEWLTSIRQARVVGIHPTTNRYHIRSRKDRYFY